MESAAATRKLFPGISSDGLTGGAIWYDYQTRHPDRLTWLVACAAQQAGATLVNYARAIGPVRSGDNRISGVRVRDEIDGREIDLDAAVTLLAPGAALGTLQRMFGAGDGPPLLRAMNVLLDRPARDIALAAPGRSGRMLTAVPWGGAVLVGTAQSESTVSPAEIAPPPGDVAAFVDDLRTAFPALEARIDHVRLVHWGLTPAVVRKGRAELRPEAEIVRHGQRGVPGLVSVIGVKYTTARSAAELAVDAVCAERGGQYRSCRTAETVLPHAGIADVEGRLTEAQRALGLELDRAVSEHLASWYGTEAPAVLEHAAGEGLLDRLDSRSPVIAGEISYAVANAAAARLSDAVLRRTPLGSAGHPGRPALARAAAIMGDRLGWTPERIEREIGEVEGRYFPPRGWSPGPSGPGNAPRT